jgi:hypothetical protein
MSYHDHDAVANAVGGPFKIRVDARRLSLGVSGVSARAFITHELFPVYSHRSKTMMIDPNTRIYLKNREMA